MTDVQISNLSLYTYYKAQPILNFLESMSVIK